jgi:DNA polymerase-1
MLIQADAKQLEWRCLAWLANDQVALQEINDDIDFHSKNQETFGLPSRLIAKVYLFRTIYRGSGWSFAHDPAFISVSSSPDFWNDINDKFFRKYTGIDKCHKEWANLVASRQPIISPLGREWLILPNPDGKLPWTVFTNYPVQGTSADLMSIARVSLFRRMQSRGLKALLVSTVHDSIVLDAPEHEVPAVVKLLYEVFNDIKANVAKIWSVNLPCMFPCEVKVGPNLRDMKKVPYTCD